MDRSALLAGVGAFAWWGLLPLYLHLMRRLHVVEVISHRIAWSLVLTLVVAASIGQVHNLRALLARPKALGLLAASASFIAINWLVYVYAVSVGQVVDAALGYFINPLVSVLLGVVVLGERLRLLQLLGVLLATAGVVLMVVLAGRLPWIALVLAFSFGFYALIRKQLSVDPLTGLTAETAVLALPALAAIGYLSNIGRAEFGHAPDMTALLAIAGVMTAAPLVMFAYAARRLPLTTIGILQYIGPSIQFFIGLWVFGEPFSWERFAGFAFIWLALAAYTADLIRTAHSPRLKAAATIATEPLAANVRRSD